MNDEIFVIAGRTYTISVFPDGKAQIIIPHHFGEFQGPFTESFVDDNAQADLLRQALATTQVVWQPYYPGFFHLESRDDALQVIAELRRLSEKT